MKCPKCGSKDIIPILYGMPSYEVLKEVDEGKLKLGGCVISGTEPRYYCQSCKKNRCYPPYLFKRFSQPEDLRKAVTELRFGIGGFFGGNKEITIVKHENSAAMRVTCNDHRDRLIDFLSEISVEKWNELMDRLYRKLYLNEWKRTFESYTLDGEQWELDIKLTGGRKRHYYGNNEYPPYWKELLSALRPFFKEAGVKL
ncbi:MAG: hypothetical protein J6112_06015 [Clostridia bacterium]|nr:hypothetical protein [Clostridia bacterium]